jgi:hypothetical protein
MKKIEGFDCNGQNMSSTSQHIYLIQNHYEPQKGEVLSHTCKWTIKTDVPIFL